MPVEKYVQKRKIEDVKFVISLGDYVFEFINMKEVDDFLNTLFDSPSQPDHLYYDIIKSTAENYRKRRLPEFVNEQMIISAIKITLGAFGPIYDPYDKQTDRILHMLDNMIPGHGISLDNLKKTEV